MEQDPNTLSDVKRRLNTARQKYLAIVDKDIAGGSDTELLPLVEEFIKAYTEAALLFKNVRSLSLEEDVLQSSFS